MWSTYPESFPETFVRSVVGRGGDEWTQTNKVSGFDYQGKEPCTKEYAHLEGEKAWEPTRT